MAWTDGMFDENRKLGLIMTGFGVFFYFLGVAMMLDRGLLAMGNLLFLSGCTLIMGVQRTLAFFFTRHRLRGTVPFAIGLLLTLSSYTLLGICVQFFGFVNLFGNFFPLVLAFLRRLPFVGAALSKPPLAGWLDRLVSGGEQRLPV